MKYTITSIVALTIILMSSSSVLAYNSSPKHTSVEPLKEIETPVEAPAPAPVKAPATDAAINSLSLDVATSSATTASPLMLSKTVIAPVSTTTLALLAEYRRMSIVASNCFQNTYDAIAYGFLRGDRAVSAYAKCWSIVPTMPSTTDAI